MPTATSELVQNKKQFNELKHTTSAQTGRENIQLEIQPWQNFP